MNWPKEDMKQYFLFTQGNKTILHNKEKGILLIADLDYFNNHITYHIEKENEPNVEYEPTLNIFDAIEKYYDFLEGENNV